MSSIEKSNEDEKNIMVVVQEDENSCAAKVCQLSDLSGMTEDFSRQCLEECNWEMKLAFEAFTRVKAASMLPEYALK